ncbi:MAG TPA: J domain-containing protein [Povalibacter sp.]|uniref:J domain-containing protein n=1 Tax=Povalibacter sp. TaxID=1962978 RepID=UPI002C698DA3|nr:J domain-containing protein [Povalibacter sp.]HMN44330.1 J domain-containing protein [Povalibacter sp.]
MSRKTSLEISSRVASTKLTPEQERFNFLIAQIEKARATLAEWEAAVAAFRQTRLQKLQPLHDSLSRACRESVFAVDRLLDQTGWSRVERAELREILRGTADVLLEANGADAEIKALYDKHSEVDFDTSRQDELQQLKAEAEEFTGLDLGDDDGILSEEDLVERMYREMAAREAADAAREDAKAQRRRESATKRRGEDSAQLARQSLREIYRRLASAVHPDREPDPVRREEKNVLMQRINQAYAANDLLTLFEAQMQIEQLDAGAIAKIGQQRLRQYNRLLAEQLSKAKETLREAKVAFVMDHGLEQHGDAQPQKLLHVIQGQARRLRAEIARQEQFLRVLASKASTRRWLKQQRRFAYGDDDD